MHTHSCECARDKRMNNNTKKRNAHTKHQRFDARIGFDIIFVGNQLTVRNSHCIYSDCVQNERWMPNVVAARL